MKRWLLYIAAAWAFFALTCWVCGRLLMTDEKRVLLQVAALARLAESGHLFTLDDAIAADYRDDWSNDKPTLLIAVRALRQRYRDLKIHLGRITAHVSGDIATADLPARVTGRAVDDAQTEIEGGEFRLTFRRVEKDWKLSRVARKEPAP